MKKLLLIIGFSISLNLSAQNIFTYGFDTPTATLLGADGWVQTNQSLPVGASTYTVPTAVGTVFPLSQAGGTISHTLINFNSTTGAGDISNWLISPVVSLLNGDVVTFYTRTSTVNPNPTPANTYPDRLELRLSSAGAFSINPSTGPTDLGDFTTLGVSVNPDLLLTGVGSYPGVWTQYSYTVSGLTGATPVDCKLALRYWVTDGGPTGTNSNIIAIDTFSVDRPEACAPPTALTAAMTTASGSTISWTVPTNAPANGYEYFYSTTNTAPTAATASLGSTLAGVTTATLSNLMMNSIYYVWVRSVCSATVTSSWSLIPATFNTTAVPNCASLVAPANAATAVDSATPVTLSWTAATTGTPATSYDLFFGTDAVPVTLIGNFTTLTTTRPAVALTQYYWKVVAKNAGGSAVGCTEVFSFTTAPSAFSPYCGPVAFTNALEPITYVNFAGIDKTYPNTVVPVATALHHKIFTDVATVAQGSTNVMQLKGMTDGNFTNRFIVYIDWNQNGVLNDAGEVYFETPELTIINSTGLPATLAVAGNIVVPATATVGNTRMRIKKIFGGVSAGSLPCAGTAFGEIHDYPVTVTLGNVATDTFASANFKFGPNPVKNVLNMSYDKNITNVSVINLLGQEVLVSKANTTNAAIDMSGLTAGAYMVKVSADNEVKTIKVIKE